MSVPPLQYRNVNLPADLVDRMDEFVRVNGEGYRTRAEVAATAVRQFLRDHDFLPAPAKPNDGKPKGPETGE